MKTKNVIDLQFIDSGLYKILSAIEAKTGWDLYLTSIKRTKSENIAVGGWEHSLHVDWDNDGDSEAVDIRRSSFAGSPESLARLAYAEGATGVGIYDTHVHIDNNPKRILNPYFKDYRKKKTKYDEGVGLSFSDFKKHYNQSLAEIRKGKNDNVPRETIGDNINKTKFDDKTLIGVGVAVVTILTLLGLIND